jgi:hypothetical protein
MISLSSGLICVRLLLASTVGRLRSIVASGVGSG